MGNMRIVENLKKIMFSPFEMRFWPKLRNKKKIDLVNCYGIWV